MSTKPLYWQDMGPLVKNLADRVMQHWDPASKNPCYIYGVPRGGVHAALLLKSELPSLKMLGVPEAADIIVDDIIDSGTTRDLYRSNPNTASIPFLALVDKQTDPAFSGKWVEFPWERMEAEQGPENNVVRMLQFIGEDPKREGLRETPARVVKSYKELFSGYGVDVGRLLKTFEDGVCDEMVLLKDIEVYSTCVAGSTFVDTPRGRIPINRLQDAEFVYCWDERLSEMTIGRAFNPRITGKGKRLWRVFTDKDTLLCTGNHKILTYNRGWVEAQYLVTGDSVVALNRGAVVENGTVRPQIVWTGKKTQVPEHRFIYQKVNGPFPKGHHIHHLNKTPADNRPENLTALSSSEHIRLHRLEDGPTGFALFTDQQRKAMRKRQIEAIRASQTEEVRRKRSSSVKRYWDNLTAEQRSERNHRVLLVEKTDWCEDVWCMDVPGYENFIANGMVVHNCEHHLLPFYGVAHVAYIPNKKVVGISKLARLVDAFAKRLQIQERLTTQITSALDTHLQPLGSACVLEAKHFCMVCRGVGKQHSSMVTSSLTGEFRNPEVRSEFFHLIKG